MENIFESCIMFLRSFTLLSVTTRIIISVILCGLIGLERGKKGQAVGLRTHVLVGLGSALSVIVGIYTCEVFNYGNDPLRVSAQVISGIGFLGVGTILVVGKSHIRGLTTAAGLWTTAGIGLACGIGYVSIAIIATMIVLVTMTLMTKFENSLSSYHVHEYFSIELNDPTKVNELVTYLKENYNISEIMISSAKSNLPGHIGLQIVFTNLTEKQFNEISDLHKKEYVTYSIQSF